MFELLLKIRPYFFSIREFSLEGKQNLISLDLKLPVKWDYNKIILKFKERLKIKEQDRGDNDMLLSLLTTNITEEGYSSLFECALEIINYNREQEEKRKLFHQKMTELEKMFKEQTEKLKQEFEKRSLSELKTEINTEEAFFNQDNDIKDIDKLDDEN